MTRVADIKCPHCGKTIRVREIEPKMSKAAKEAFDKMERAFRDIGKVFDKPL